MFAAAAGLCAQLAAASPAPAELPGTGHTLPRGTAVVHPLLVPSSIAAADRVEVRFPTLGVVFGPWAAIEVGLVQGDDVAVSVEVAGGAPWRLDAAMGAARVAVSGRAGRSWLTGTVGAGVSTGDVPLAVPGIANRVPAELLSGVPVGLAWDAPVSHRTAVRVAARIDPVSVALGPVELSAGARVITEIGQTVRASVGAALYGGPHPILDPLPPTLAPLLRADPLWLPVPTAEVWWRF